MRRIYKVKFIILAFLIMGCMAMASYYLGRTIERDNRRSQSQILTAKIEGQDYIVGSVTDGVQTIDQMAIFALLLANAEDPGIMRTAAAIGFRGPMSVQEIQARQAQEGVPDETP